MCLAARPAFTGAHVIALLAKVLLEEAPRVTALRPEVPAELADLLQRLLHKSPEDRPANAGAVLSALAAMDAPSAARFTLSSTSTRNWSSNSPMLVSVPIARKWSAQASIISSSLRVRSPCAFFMVDGNCAR